jgi:hypothetical protein
VSDASIFQDLRRMLRSTKARECSAEMDSTL